MLDGRTWWWRFHWPAQIFTIMFGGSSLKSLNVEEIVSLFLSHTSDLEK